MSNKIVHVIGGGTVSYIRSHLALSAPAYGSTARRIASICKDHDNTMDVELHLTRMADPTSRIETNDDLRTLVGKIMINPLSKIVFSVPLSLISTQQ